MKIVLLRLRTLLLFFIFPLFLLAETNQNIIKYNSFFIFLSDIDYNTNITIVGSQKLTPPITNKKLSSLVPIKSKKSISTTNKKKEIALSEEDQFFNSGVKLFKQKNYKEAEDIFIDLLQRYPDTRLKYNVTYYLGEIQLGKHQEPEALMYYNKIIQEAPESDMAAKSYYSIAWIAYQNKRYSESLKDLNLIMAQYPKSSISDEAYLLQAQVYAALKQFENALSSLNVILEKYKDSDSMAKAYFALAELYEKAPPIRNLEKSLENYQMIVDHYPDSPYVLPAKKRIQFLKDNFLDYK